ncbi:MAG: hypothetical protein Q9188_001176 [Gyalolechia gomerana]
MTRADNMSGSKPATETIQKQQQVIRTSLPFSDKVDFDNAQKGFVDRLEPNIVKKEGGGEAWNNDSYDFLNPTSSDTDGPDTANPSLWRQSKLVTVDGLFKITDSIYQVRGLDLSNTTIIEGNEGIIVIDPLTSMETGAAANQLYQKNFGPKEVKAIIYTHSHVDHFGGIKGFVSQEDVDKNGVKVIAPEGFLEQAVSENVYAGTAMSRRAAYMYGAALNRDPKGQIGAGLGQTVSTGTVTLINPTDHVTETGQSMTVDGIKMVFQMAPDTEAPAEMLIFFPELARCVPLRMPLTHFTMASVIFASHHWPTWGYEEVVNFLTLQRDLYAYVHDQTLRLLNKGFNGPEIAEQMLLPPALDNAWNARGYYGSVNHNVKAIYQRYIGWFDGNPAHLWEHIPVERAKRYVDLAGGLAKIVQQGQAAFDKGDFRWAAEILNHAVFAKPDYTAATSLLADTYEQLGYGAENGTWRNFFLSGTTELRTGNFGTPTQTASDDVIAQLAPEMLFDAFAIQINGPEAWGQQISIKVVLTDGPRYRWWLSNGALVYTKVGEDATADVTLTTSTSKLPGIVRGFDPAKLKEAGIDVSGDTSALDRLSALLDAGDPKFNIVIP